MTDAAQIVENLINTEGIHAFVFVCEAADKYLPIIESVAVALQNGKMLPVTEIDKSVARKVDETRRTLKREDRIVWALRFYKKALVEQLMWMVQNEPEFFQKRFRSPPLPEQKSLERQLQKLGDTDITPFQEYDPNDPETMESPYSGFSVIDAVNQRIGHFLDISAKYSENDPQTPIQAIRFDRQSFGEIVSLFRRAEIDLMRRKAASIHIWPTPGGPYDMADEEGPVETLVKFPNGWRWFDLHRNCSQIRNDPQAPSNTAITGHCANTVSKGQYEALELAEPLGGDRWKHHAFFLLGRDGLMTEMKGRKNQKPSPRLHKYIMELFRRDKRIKGVNSVRGWNPAHDFAIADLPKVYQDTLRKERPELFSGSREADEPATADQ